MAHMHDVHMPVYGAMALRQDVHRYCGTLHGSKEQVKHTVHMFLHGGLQMSMHDVHMVMAIMVDR